MPEIEVRPVGAPDWPTLMKFDRHYETSYVWQMENLKEDGQVNVNFRQVRLPRPVRVEYPRTDKNILDDWARQGGIVLAAHLGGQVAGFIHLTESISPQTAWVTDLAVRVELRCHGIGSGLILAGQEWASERRQRRVVVEMQSKNYPALQTATKLGYEFCGFQDQYYQNQDIALLFTRFLR